MPMRAYQMNHDKRAVVYQKKFAYTPVKCDGNRWVWLKTYRTKTIVLGMAYGLFEIHGTLKLTNADAIIDRLAKQQRKSLTTK